MMQSYFTRSQYQNNYGNRESEDKYAFLRRVFPSIQLGRDIDLEMYIQLRLGGKPVDRWKHHYNQLAHKYTPDERKILIHVIRKYNHDFNRVFSIIIDKLYRRLLKYLERKIDLILEILGGVDSEQARTEQEKILVVEKIKKSLEVCSLNHAKAFDDINLLEYFSNTFGYKQQVFMQTAVLLKLYLNGLLFVEKMEYKFDIKEEKRKFKGVPQNMPQEVSAMRLYITRDDLEKMMVDESLENEYDLAFAFYEKYFAYVRDVNFANKVFLYSQTYKTNHYRIFECMKRGLLNKFRKDRIYDDVFKIICEGRYIYDINKEKQIQRRIWLFNKAVDKAERMERLNQRRIKRTVAQARIEADRYKTPRDFSSLDIQEKTQPVFNEKEQIAWNPKAELERPAATKPQEKKPETTKQAAGFQPAGKERKNVFQQKSAKTNKTVTEMIEEIAEDPAAKRMLAEEFKSRLSGYILKYFQDIPGINLQRDEDLKRFKDFIKYMLHNYDTIITDRSNEKLYDRELKAFGFNLNLFYTIIFECFMDLKSDYLLNNMHKRPFPGIFGFFSRLFGKKKKG